MRMSFTDRMSQMLPGQIPGPTANGPTPVGHVLTPTQQLAEAAKMTRSKEMTKVTAENIRLWPFAVDPDLQSARAAVDLSARCEHQEEATNVRGDAAASAIGATCGVCGHKIGAPTVEYEWVDGLKKASWRPTGHYKFRLRELERVVKIGLGQRFSLTVNMNGKRIFPFAEEPRARKRKNSGPGASKRKAARKQRTKPKRR
jgi:hypothetical protein